VQYHASIVSQQTNSAPQNHTKGSMVDIPQSVCRPHYVHQTNRAPSEQRILRHPARVPRAAYRSPGRGDNLPDESVIDRLN